MKVVSAVNIGDKWRCDISSTAPPTSIVHELLRTIGEAAGGLYPWPALGVFLWQLQVDHRTNATPTNTKIPKHDAIWSQYGDASNLLNSERRSPFLMRCVEGLAIARMSGVTQCENIPFRALSGPAHLCSLSYLQLRPPQKREHCKEPADSRLSLSEM